MARNNYKFEKRKKELEKKKKKEEKRLKKLERGGDGAPDEETSEHTGESGDGEQD